VARAQAVVRRSGQIAVPKRLAFGGITLDAERHAVYVGEQEAAQLTPLEYRLLETLVLNREQVLPFDTLIDRVWGPDGGDKAMLKQLVYRLRRKIEPGEGRESDVDLEAIPGVGYALMRADQA
ncbi:MAG: DNA-binding response regulator, partial [Chloroflexi bacterium]|nr:DNA-binding response regulator [Chloroflexota bacterium]